jgi:hypothetical protein
MAQNSSSAGIPSANCWTSPLYYYLDKIRYSGEGFLRYFRKGFSKGKKWANNTKLLKMTLFNII